MRGVGWSVPVTTVIRDNVPDAVWKLKEDSDQDILVAGSAQLVRTLAEYNPVDSSKRFSSGIVVLTYQPGLQEGQETQQA